MHDLGPFVHLQTRTVDPGGDAQAAAAKRARSGGPPG